MPKKPTDTCSGCGSTYVLNQGTCTITSHKYQPWLDYMTCTCPKCGFVTRIFCSQESIELVLDYDNDTEIIWTEWAPQATVESANQVYGISLLKEEELTPRKNRIVAFWAYLLEKGERPEWLA